MNNYCRQFYDFVLKMMLKIQLRKVVLFYVLFLFLLTFRLCSKRNKSSDSVKCNTSIQINTSLKDRDSNRSDIARITSVSNINFTLRTFNRNRPIVFLHIGKTGGTSFDATLTPIVKKLNGQYIGHKHFTWSYIETIPNPDVVVMLREPVSRVVSCYHFKRKTSNDTLNVVPLPVYLKDPGQMLKTRRCWHDGHSGVSWLTGTHMSPSVSCTSKELATRERMSLNIYEMCLLAAKRLESTFWFGILEDMERSLELLQYQLGLSQKIAFPHKNRNKHDKAFENETDILATLIPQDIWLYEYAKLLFEARWTYYKTGIYVNPKMPKIPRLEDVPCISTCFILLCRTGPLRPLYFVDPEAPLEFQRLPEDIGANLKLDNYYLQYNNISKFYND